MLAVEKREETLVIKVSESRVDMVIARKFRELLTEQISNQPKRVILDLSVAQYFDSSALGALVAFMKDVKAYGGELVLCNLSRSLLTLLKLSRLDLLFEISDNLEKSIR
ncbi:MAG: STAS domain-containing protein [Leptospiraceae bacterium]|nr:STAS domain-containing protein [Leptospiraceae bacterium]